MLVACQRIIRTWPVAARIAFREAVLADVSTFSRGDWDPIQAQIAAEIFIARWRRGQPWPPGPTELAPRPAPPPELDREAIATLARRIRALGLPLALASR